MAHGLQQPPHFALSPLLQYQGQANRTLTGRKDLHFGGPGRAVLQLHTLP